MTYKADKIRPKTARGLVAALNKGQQLDARTRVSKSVRQCRDALEADLNKSAIAMLRHDASVAAAVQALALSQAMADKSKIIGKDGRPHYALETWKKFSILKKGCLLGLRKFSNQDEPEDSDKNLGDLILEVSDPTEQPEHYDDVDNDELDNQDTEP